MVHKPKSGKATLKPERRTGPKWDSFGNTRTSIILDKESYYLISAASKKVYGQVNLTGALRSATRGWAMEVLGKNYMEQADAFRIQAEGGVSASV